ncbi:protein of unknown function [Clostridium beijerinckii]|nr:protein of unknown function [Clostridium beijerinckii]
MNLLYSNALWKFNNIYNIAIIKMKELLISTLSFDISSFYL